MTDISKNVIKKIKKEKIEPYSKKHFFLKKSIIWTLFGLAILLGIIASSVAIFQIKHADWDLYHLLDYSLLSYVILIIPYFWLVFLIIFLVVANIYFQRTERGYRIKPALVILAIILLSITGGFLLYQTGFSEKLESIFQEKVPIYRWLHAGRHRVWMSPQKGLLAGEIIKINSAQEIVFKDLNEDHWTVDVSSALWRGRLRPEIGLKIKLMGKMQPDRQFLALEIRPLYGRYHSKHRRARGFRHKKRYQ